MRNESLSLPAIPRHALTRYRRELLLPLICLLLLAGATLLLLDRPLIRGDGVAYLAWLDSLALDGDLDLANQADKLAPVNSYQVTFNQSRQQYSNVFPFGVAILQAPFYLVGHLFARQGWWQANSDYFLSMQGVSAPYSLWLMIGSNLMGMGSMLLVWWVGRKLCGDWTAVLVAWAVFIGSPIIYYSTVMPLNSHSAGNVTFAFFLILSMRLTSFPRPWRAVAWSRGQAAGWFAVGASAGLMVLARWQLLLAAVPFVLLWLWRRQWRPVAWMGAGFLLTAWPLPLVWNDMFGQPFVIPYDAAGGEGFLSLPGNSWQVMRATFGDTPILLLSLPGLVRMQRVDRGWTIAAGAVIGLQLLVNGSVLDWWAGETYGMRRMSELYPLFAILICAAMGNRLPQDPLSWSSVRIMWLTRAVLLLLVGYNLVYMSAFFHYTWTNNDHLFTNTPTVLLRSFFGQPDRWHTLRAVLKAHVGPWAWSMPGP